MSRDEFCAPKNRNKKDNKSAFLPLDNGQSYSKYIVQIAITIIFSGLVFFAVGRAYFVDMIIAEAPFAKHQPLLERNIALNKDQAAENKMSIKELEKRLQSIEINIALILQNQERMLREMGVRNGRRN